MSNQTNTKEKQVASSSTKDFLRGLNGLGGGASKRLTALPVDQIDPDEDQPRGSLHGPDGLLPEDVESEIAELAASIAAIGLQQPIKVREAGAGRYTIIMGERRWRAVSFNRLRGVPHSDTIDCIIEQGMDADRLMMAQLAENLNRSDLTDLEVARYLKKKMDSNPALMKKNLAELIRRPPSYISRILGLLNPKYEELVGSGLITYASLLEQLKALPDEEQARVVAQAQSEGRAITSGDVKAARGRVKKDSAPTTKPIDVVEGTAAVLAEQTRDGEMYVPSPQVMQAANTSSVQPSPNQAEHGDESGATQAVGGESISDNTDGPSKAKVSLTIAQLKKLLAQTSIGDESLPVTMYMPMPELESVLTALGCRVPKEKTVWPLTLAERLND